MSDCLVFKIEEIDHDGEKDSVIFLMYDPAFGDYKMVGSRVKLPVRKNALVHEEIEPNKVEDGEVEDGEVEDGEVEDEKGEAPSAVLNLPRTIEYTPSYSLFCSSELKIMDFLKYIICPYSKINETLYVYSNLPSFNYITFESFTEECVEGRIVLSGYDDQSLSTDRMCKMLKMLKSINGDTF